MQQHKQQTGFSAAILLIIIVGIAGAGLSGWYVWHKNKGPDASQQAANSSSTNHKPSTSADPSEGGTYLVIKEWGVRFPLPEELRGDVYTYLSDAESSGTVAFASKKLNGLTGDRTCDFIKQPDGGYLGGVDAQLARINPATYDKNYLDYYKSQLTYIKKIGPWEYYLRKELKNPPITCLTGVHEEFNDVEQSITDQLNTAFGKLEEYK